MNKLKEKTLRDCETIEQVRKVIIDWVEDYRKRKKKTESIESKMIYRSLEIEFMRFANKMNKKEITLKERIWTPNHKSKNYIELYDLEIILKEFIENLKDEIEDAQEDYGNLDWISKEQALKIIKRRAGED